jgi:hypothetical protein
VIFLGEISIFCILAGLLLSAPALGNILLVILVIGTAFALMPITDRQKELLQDRFAFLLVLLLTVCSLDIAGQLSPAGLLLAVPAGLLAIIGLVRALVDRKRSVRWSNLRKNLVGSLGITVLAVGLVTGMARAALAFRSQVPIEPGRVDFLINLLLAAAIGFGLDAHLRAIKRPGSQGPFQSLWDRRHALGMLAVLAVNLAGRCF